MREGDAAKDRRIVLRLLETFQHADTKIFRSSLWPSVVLIAAMVTAVEPCVKTFLEMWRNIISNYEVMSLNKSMFPDSTIYKADNSERFEIDNRYKLILSDNTIYLI